MSRPKGPSPNSNQRVLNALRYCTCGKMRNPADEPSFEDLYNTLKGIQDGCECVAGGKSPSDLPKLTGLHPNTTKKVCKHLLDKGVVNRERLRKHGNHVRYSVSPDYKEQQKVLDIEYSKGFRKQCERDMKRTQSHLEQFREYQRFKRSNIQIFRAYPWLEHLPPNQIMCLVRLINVHGYERAAQLFITQRDRLAPKQFLQFVNDVALGRFMM